MVALIGVGFSAIIYNLANIQFVQADELRRNAVSQQMWDTVTSPNRGEILDINMTVLARSSTVWTVILSPKALETEEERNLVADGLSELLEIDRQTLYDRTLKTWSQYEIIKRKINDKERDELNAWIDENKMSQALRTIDDYKRYYPNNNLLSGVLGFTGSENTGLYGLEAYYEKTLAGKAGRIITARNGANDRMPIKMKFEKKIEAENGKSLVLTIDSVVQYYAEKYLEIAIKETGCKNRGSVIIMDVKTGAIVAMATKGDFDPNNPMEVSNPTSAALIAKLAGDEQSAALKSAREQQWINKPVFDFYEPGSVFKTFTSAAALEERTITAHTTFNCSGSLVVGGSEISCHKKGGHGIQTFAQALSNSCNPAFMKVGESLGRDLFFKYYTAFGFTEPTGIDMLSESRVTPALYHTAEKLNVVELAIAAFGQRNKVTPIQMITAMSAVANGGYLMEPYVVDRILNADGSVFSTTEPKVKRQVISEQVSRQLCEMLGEVATSGGSINAYIPGYRVGGKTGTSEKLDIAERNQVVSSFSGFAPYEDPQYAILVMLDEPSLPETVRYGGTIAAPVAQKIFSEALPYLGIDPKYTPEEIAKLECTTPDVRGKSVSEAQNMLDNAQLKYSVYGNGDKVLKQVPANGQTIPRGGKVALYTTEEEMETTVKVPDFTGKTLIQANEMAAKAGVNLQLTGSGLQNGSAIASSQDIAAGTEVPPGRVIKVSFVVHDDTVTA